MNRRLGDEPASDRIVRRKLSDQVFERLHAMIGSELKPGDVLPSERDLMERFGVGRPAIREALQSLQNKGLITIAHGERSRVNVLSTDLAVEQMNEVARLLLSTEPSNLDYLKEARRLFETGVVGIAARNATAEDVADLRSLVGEQASHLGDAPAFVAVDMRFHVRIAALTGNPIIVTVSDAMLRWLFEYHHSLLHWSGNEDVTLAEHARIVDLIEAGDADGAVEAMRAHLDRSDALYVHRS
ncbi:transcriptional regulator NanR [Acuticoccus sediminis]|uniref:transcriptional regulator NanR n=1 Tax=Acuticoccus sediminis TaxID=2184697 RepID=UPI001CFE6AD7|nr:transcriptional regulator NanR [Acuticoccus sediminis]